MDFEEMLRENHEKISKGKLEVDSEYCSGYVIPNIHTTHAPSSISKFFVDDFGAASGSMRSHCYSNECTVVDPDDFTSQNDLRFLEVIQNMCCEPPRMPFDPAVKSNYVAAFNASIISYLNKFLGLRVLVLGMDAQEADLVRLDKAAALNAISPDVIVVDDNLVSGHKYRGSFPHLKSISTYASLSDFVNSRDFGPLLTNIVANHTFTSFCTRDVRSMEKLLYHHGKGKQFLSFCGTFMDPASIVVEKASGVSPEETMVEYLGLKIRDGKTYHKIRVFDSIFYDPVYSTDEICALFKRCGWELDIYHSSKFVQLMGKIKSSVAKNLANIQCLRIALARPSAREPLEEEITVPDNVVLSQFEKDITLVPQMSFKAFPVHKNKGVPLNGRDIAAMGDSWWWGPKLDGVHCQMWLEKDRLCVSCGLGSFVVRLHGGFDSKTYLEGEIIFNQEYTERFEPFDNVSMVAKMIKNIVVFDGMAEYNNREDPFMTRWRSIEGIVLSRKDVRGLIVLQKWRKPIDIRKEEFMAFKEGIVIQPIFAPPGRFRNGFGSARYIKYRWTYEILNVKLGVIEEVVLGTKEFVRFRKDRTLPSTVEDIARIEGAVSLTELILFERVMYHYYSQIPAKYMTGEVGEGFKPYFVANVDEYMKVMAEDTLLGTCLTDRAKEAFIEMAEVTFGDLYSLPFKDWLKRVGVHETVKMASVDRDMLKKAQFVLDRSLYNNPLLNLNAIPAIGGGGLELDDVQFHSVETFVKSNLVDEALYTHWQAVISRKEIDNVFVHRIIGDDIQAEGCYLFHEVPVTVNHVYVNRARLMRNHYIKRKFDGVPFKHKEFVSPSVYVQGYDISDLKGETMHERIANAKKILVENKGLAHPVVVRFVLDKDVYLRCKHSFIALEAAISAAQLQYIGIVCVGI